MPTTLFGTSGDLGVNLGQAFTPDTSSTDYINGLYPNLALGTRVTANNNSEWMQVLLSTGGVTGDGYAVVINADFTAVMLSTSTDVYGKTVGVPQCGAALSGDYIWVQIAGQCSGLRVSASATANSILAATVTPGQLNSGATSGRFVNGVVLSTANGGSAGTAPAILNFPVVATIATPAP